MMMTIMMMMIIIIQFNSILIYLHANLTAQGQLQSEHKLGYRNKRTQIKPQCEQASNNNNNNLRRGL
jgi:hypothetical protein